MLLAGPAAAGDRLAWQDHWAEGFWVDGLVTLTAGGGRLWVDANLEPTEAPRLDGTIPGDALFRDLLRVESRSSRDRVDTFADVTAVAVQAYPLLVDIGGVALVGDGNLGVAGRLTVMFLETQIVSAFANRASQRVFRRARPLAKPCEADGGYDALCHSPGRYSSLWSGHTSSPATSAGFACAVHAHLPLYGGGWADRAICGVLIVGAAAAGTARIMGDKHYFSDVLAGGLGGFAVGYAAPWAHFELFADEPTTGEIEPVVRVVPVAARDAFGLGLIGVY